MTIKSDKALDDGEIDTVSTRFLGGVHVVTVTKGKSTGTGSNLDEDKAFAAAVKDLKS